MVTKGETLTKELLKKRFNIDCISIPREQRATSDYFLKINKTIAVCEVKDIKDQIPSEENGWKKGDFGFFSRPVNDESRIGHKIQEAFAQLKDYNEPKVLVIVDFDGLPYPTYSLNAAVTGVGGSERIIITETMQGVHTDTNSYHIARGKIKDKVRKINLYFWIDAKKEKIAFRIFPDDAIGKKLQKLIWKRDTEKHGKSFEEKK